MSSSDLQHVKQNLVEAGVEIYRVQTTEIQVAERVRLHIMDSGVRVRRSPDGGLGVSFTVRSQRSDFPSLASDELFQKVRESMGQVALDRGYQEEEQRTVSVTDPMNASRVLDTWHEITYAKPLAVETVVDEVRWALSVDKYVPAP